VNLTSLNQIKEEVLNITYFCNVKPDIRKSQLEQKIPVIDDWEILEFTEYALVLKLNFTNKLYVSSAIEKDLLGIEVLESRIFISTKDFLTIEQNYTLSNYTLPAQAAS